MLQAEQLEARQLLSVTLYWDPSHGSQLGGTGTWGTSTANWSTSSSGGGTMYARTNGDAAVFGGAGAAVTLASGTIQAASIQFASSTYSIGSNILTLPTRGTTTINVASGDTATINSVIAGYGNLTKTDSGTLVISGANYFAGSVTISGGAIDAASEWALGSEGALTINTGATLNLNSQYVNTGGLTGGGTVTNISSAAALLTVVPSGTASFSGTLENGSSGGGTLAFAVSGSGTQALSGSGSSYNYSGGEAISGGGKLEASSAVEMGGGPLSLYNGTLDVTPNANFSWSPAISLCAAGATVEVDSRILTLTGAISGTGSLTTQGAGTLDLAGGNYYTGTNTIKAGMVDAGSAWALGAEGTLTVDAGATLNLNGQNVNIGGLTGSGIVTDYSTASGTSYLTMVAPGGTTFGGTIENGPTRLIEVVMSGSGTQTLSGTNFSYTSYTVTTLGQLALDPITALGNTPIVVESGAYFSPNPCGYTNSAGLTVSGSAGATLDLLSGSYLDIGSIGTFDLQQETSFGFANTALTINTATLDFGLSAAGWAKMAVTASASVLGTNTINVNAMGATLVPNTYKLITASGGLTGTFKFANGTTTEDATLSGGIYSLALGNAATAESVTVAPLLVLNQSPSSETVSAGNNASFTVAATGTPTPSVQWYESTNGGTSFSAISGATSTTYSFTAATGEDGYEYEAKFTNSAGTVTTAAATLSVPPVVNTSPANETVNVGGTATFTAAATGTPTPAVQWYVSTNSGGTFSKISGATSASLSIVNANTTESGNDYKACFTNSGGSTYTAVATLTVGTAPVITANPASQTINAGGYTTFTAAASGSPAPPCSGSTTPAAAPSPTSPPTPASTAAPLRGGVHQQRRFDADHGRHTDRSERVGGDPEPGQPGDGFRGSHGDPYGGGRRQPNAHREVGGQPGHRGLHRANQQQLLQRRCYRHAHDHRADHCDERIPVRGRLQ